MIWPAATGRTGAKEHKKERGKGKQVPLQVCVTEKASVDSTGGKICCLFVVACQSRLIVALFTTSAVPGLS